MSQARPDAVLTSRLAGTWRLLHWDAELEDGSISWPFGERAQGYVVYTADGRMITTISRAGRTPIGGDILAAPAEARAEAFGSFLAYAGTFRVEGGDVVHHVEMSLFPDWVGTEQRRHVGLSDDGSVLTLSTDPIPSAGRTARHRLRWERLGG